MTIEVVCSSCGSRFGAGAALAGKKVRCRQCQAVLAVPRPAPHTSPHSDSSAATAVGGSVPPPAAARDEGQPDWLDPGAGEEPDFSAATPSDLHTAFWRASRQYDFPLGRWMDRWLGVVLLVIWFAWMTLQSFTSDTSGRAWTVPLRMIVLAGLYALFIVPVTAYGVRQGATRARFVLPPGIYLRTAGSFISAVALGYILWLVLSSVWIFLTGFIVGLGVSVGAAWLLLRLKPHELWPSLWLPTLWLSVTTAVSIGFLLFLNFVVNAAVRGGGPDAQLAGSPLGPGFFWDSTSARGATPADAAQPAPPPSSTKPAAIAVPAATQPAAQATVGAPMTLAPPPPLISALPPSPSSTPVISAAPPANGPVVAPPPSLPQAHPNIAAATSAPAPSTQPAAGAPNSFADRLRERNLPLVKDVADFAAVGSFDATIWPTVSSPWIAVIRHEAPDQDRVECWNALTMTRGGSASFRWNVDAPTSLPRAYALSPDGAQIARLIDFPRLSLQVCWFDISRSPKWLELRQDQGTPSIVGFAAPDQLMVRWEKGDSGSLDTWDVSSGQRARTTSLPTYQPSPVNGQLSPDGKLFALVTRARGQGQVHVFDLLHPSQPPKALPIYGLDERWATQPAGLAFSGDSQKAAVFFEHAANGFASAWRIRDGNFLALTICPVGPPPPPGRVEVGGAIDWVGDAMWLIHGSILVDAGKGTELARIADAPAISQHFISGSSFIIHTADDTARNRLALVTFAMPTKAATQPVP